MFKTKEILKTRLTEGKPVHDTPSTFLIGPGCFAFNCCPMNPSFAVPSLDQALPFINQTDDGLWLQTKKNQNKKVLEAKLRVFDKKIAVLMERADAIAHELNESRVLEMRVLTRHTIGLVEEETRKKKARNTSRRMLALQREREDAAFRADANQSLLPSPDTKSFVVDQEVNVTLFDLGGQSSTLYVMCVFVFVLYEYVFVLYECVFVFV